MTYPVFACGYNPGVDPKSMLWNAHVAPRQPRPAEHLWMLRKAGQLTEAQLRGHGEYGWELQLLRQGDLYARRRFDLRTQAVAFGEEIRRQMKAEGWQSA